MTLSSPMARWNEWVDLANRLISQGGHASEIKMLTAMLSQMTEPMPERVSWQSLVGRDSWFKQNGPGLSRSAKGTLLEFALSLGSLGIYHVNPRCESDGKAAAMMKLGDALVAMGAKPSPDMIPIALTIGLDNLDGPDRLRAALRWGGASCGSLQRALAICCANSAWDESGGQKCLDILIDNGALADARNNFESCPPEMHPVATAAMVGGLKTLRRLLDVGIPLNWVDPDTGATLWHIASGLNIHVGKALTPALQAFAPQLAGNALSKPFEMSSRYDLKLSIRAGQGPLHCACDGVKPIPLLAALACGAPVDMVDSRGDTPLTLLSRRWGAKAHARGEPMAEALLKAGADPSRVDKKGKTPAQNMAAKGPLGALASLLAARPQDVAGEDAKAKSAFEELSARGAQGLAQAEAAVMKAIFSQPSEPAAKGRARMRSL